MTAALLFVTLIVFTGYEFLKQLWVCEYRVAVFKTGLPLVLGGLIFLGIYVGLDFLIPAADTWYTSSSLLKASGYTTSLFSGDNVYNLIEFLIMGFNPFSSPVTWDLWLHFGIAILIVLGIIILFIRNTPGDQYSNYSYDL
jgi:hypothetical protein